MKAIETLLSSLTIGEPTVAGERAVHLAAYRRQRA